MTDSIDESGTVVGSAGEHSLEVGRDFVLILPVLDVVPQMLDHVGDLDVGPSVLRTLERTDAGGYG